MKKLYMITLLLSLCFSSISALKAQCPTDFIQLQPNINGTFLNLGVLNQGSQALPITVEVNFGDGSATETQSMSTFTSFNHQYIFMPQVFTYILCVTATDNDGCIDSTCIPITIASCQIQALFDYSQSGNDFTFIGTASGGTQPYTYNYSLNGSIIGNSAMITTELPLGVNTVCLNVIDAQGCQSNSYCLDIVNNNCDYQLDGSISYAGGNQLQVQINNFDTQYQYYLTSNPSQIFVPIINPTSTVEISNPNITNYCIQVYSNGAICSQNAICETIDFPNENIGQVGGYVWNDQNGNGIWDEGENPISNAFVSICPVNGDSANCIFTFTDIDGYYDFSVFPGDYNIFCINNSSFSVMTTPTQGSYNFTLNAGDDFSAFNFGFQNQQATVSGIVFYDANNNGIFDVGEAPAANKLVTVGSFTTITNGLGQYWVNVFPGNVVVSLSNPGNGYAISVPVSPHTYNFTAVMGGTYPFNDFGLYADPNFTDLSAHIHQISTVTPGFPVMNSLKFCNNGLTPQSGSFTLVWDAQITVSGPSVFNPAPSTIDLMSRTATWNFVNLGPGACTFIYMNAMAPVSLVLGTPVQNVVTVTPLEDSNPANNIAYLNQIVVGSWDPNDKQVIPQGIGEQGLILPNTGLSYTIRFQNTGSAPAVNVVLIDTVSTELVLESLQMNASSHPYSIIVDAETRVIRWTFSNIMLPDSTSDPEGSIGFVNFSINPVLNQADGTQLENFADIYFDFNEPIRTNTALNTIDRFLAIEGIQKNDLSVQTYPNPFNGFTNFLVNTGAETHAIVEIFNTMGSLVDRFSVVNGQSHQVDASHWSAGIYIYSVKVNQQIKQGKLIVNH